MTKVLSLVAVAFVVGTVHTFIKPHLDNVVPSSWKSHWAAQSFFTGAFILIAVVISTVALRALTGGKVGKVVA